MTTTVIGANQYEALAKVAEEQATTVEAVLDEALTEFLRAELAGQE
jgi:hypothetical protein